MTHSALKIKASLIALFLVAGFALTSFVTPSGYKVGDQAMNFALKNVDGKMVSLNDLKNVQGAIVVFTCNHCPFAKMYEFRLNELNETFAPKGYPVIAISPSDPSIVPDDSYESMVKYAQEKHFTFPYLFDAGQTVSKSFGATNTPHAFVLAKENGGFVVKYIGAIDDNAQAATEAKHHYVADAINALLAGKTVAVEKTKAIGCGVKYKS